MFLQMKQQLGLLQCRAPEGGLREHDFCQLGQRPELDQNMLLSTEQFDQEAVQEV